ncbi:MAG TPA: PKD domain-containing protein [Bacteroidales bacterium]|nr:PKD domain-containing protein [Bacteroidales bacterium]HRZ48254.1 PKD domain-containing protein [Bacteroidales bacterium]
MKTLYKNTLWVIAMGFLLLIPGAGRGGVIQFVGVVYDMVTFSGVSGKNVWFELKSITPAQQIHQQTLVSGPTGEVITQPFNLTDSLWYIYTFKLTDCKNDTLVVYDSLRVNGHDTLFLYLGICHSVMPGNCTAGFTFQPDTANPFIISFTNTSTGNPTGFFWSFGDGTTSVVQNPVKQYVAPGAYLVCLTITDSVTACLHTACQVISITQGVTIQAAFSAQLDSFALTPRMVHFTDESAANIPLNHYLWGFGDGQQAQIANPSHQYQQSGSYLACLMVGFAGGLHDSLCKTVVVPEYYNLWGQIFAGPMPADSGRVQLINPVHTPAGFAVLDEISLTGIGLYFFAQRIDHTYLLRSFPDYSNPQSADYVPSYSGNTVFWKEAAQIVLNSDTGNLDIKLVEKIGTKTGLCAVGGTVRLNAGIPYPGALVLLLDPAGNSVLHFTFADSAGNWSLQQLPYGTYKLVAEVPGLEAVPALVDFTPTVTSVSNVTLLLNTLTGITDPETAISVTCRPNPASTTLHLTMPSGISPREVFIYNAAGLQVRSKRVEDVKNDDVTIDVSGLSTGVYSIMVNTNAGTGRLRFVKID